MKKFQKIIAEITTDETIEQENYKNYKKKPFKKVLGCSFIHLKFWMEDGSAAFEKTDIYIEKSVKLSFDLMNIALSTALLTLENLFSKKKQQKTK
jgi:hypothetical protein